MSAKTQHVYRITYISVSGEEVQEHANAKVGGFMVDTKHVRKHHEPVREWCFLMSDMSVNSDDPFVVFVGEHIGEYEKVKDYLPREPEGDDTARDMGNPEENV